MLNSTYLAPLFMARESFDFSRSRKLSIQTSMAELSHKERYAWSSREIDILIALWDNEDVLYNTRCVDYFKRDKRIEALERISDTLKIPIPEIRKKMTNLRTYYGKELWKEKKSQKNGEEADPLKTIYMSRWQFFKPLNFLRENCNPRHNSKSDINETCDGVYDDDDHDDCDDTWVESNLLASLNAVGDEKGESREETVEEGNSVSNEHIENDSSMSQKTSPMSKKIEKRKRTGEDIESVIAKLRRSSKPDIKDQDKVQGVSMTELKSSNPDMVFAHHVGLTLMNIKNPKIKDLAKLKVQQVLYETQYGEEISQTVQVQAFPIAGLQVKTT